MFIGVWVGYGVVLEKYKWVDMELYGRRYRVVDGRSRVVGDLGATVR